MTGDRGRFSILEVLTVATEVEQRIAARETAHHIAEAALRAGMNTLWESGLAHVLKGESTIDELLRVVDVPQEDDHAPRPSAPPQRQGARTSDPRLQARTSGAVQMPRTSDRPRAPDQALPLPAEEAG